LKDTTLQSQSKRNIVFVYIHREFVGRDRSEVYLPHNEERLPPALELHQGVDAGQAVGIEQPWESSDDWAQLREGYRV
jgi:hypothetical protein